MSRIVIDARTILDSTGRVVRKELEYLPHLDTDNDYYILLHDDAEASISLDYPNFHKVKVSEQKFSFAEQLTLPRRLKALRPDLVHFTMPNQPAFFKARTATTLHDLTALRFRDPTAHAPVFKVKQAVFKWLLKRAARKSSAILTGTQYVKRELAGFAGVRPENIYVIPYAADAITEPPEALPDLTGKRFIFYVGRAQAHKNLSRLVAAFEQLHAKDPGLLLVLAGRRSGNYELIERQAQSSAAAGNVIFTDFVSDAQLRWMYENAQAYVFPSLSEGFGLPGLEAMVQGCPVVSSNATCLPEVYGEAAHYFDPLKPDDIALKISDVLNSPTLRQDLIEKGRRQAAKYSWQHAAEQTLALYRQLLSE